MSKTQDVTGSFISFSSCKEIKFDAVARGKPHLFLYPILYQIYIYVSTLTTSQWLMFLMMTFSVKEKNTFLMYHIKR